MSDDLLTLLHRARIPHTDGMALIGRHPLMFPDAVPDLDDEPTRLHLLATLAHRLDLDPTWGVALSPWPGGGWLLSTPDGAVLLVADRQDPHLTPPARQVVVEGVETDDPARALALALCSTAPTEER